MRKLIRHYIFISVIFSWFIFTPRIIKDDMFNIFHEEYPNMSYKVYSLCVCYTTINRINLHEYLAIVKQESNFVTTAINFNYDKMTGALLSWDSGLGQWNSNNIFGKDPRIFDPEFNIRLSTKYYADCRRKAKGDLRLAFCMYNAGMNRTVYLNEAYANIVLKYYRTTMFKADNLLIWM